MPVKLAKQQPRQYNTFNAIASARIEGIYLTPQFQRGLHNYLVGTKNIAKLIEETKQRHIESSIR